MTQAHQNRDVPNLGQGRSAHTQITSPLQKDSPPPPPCPCADPPFCLSNTYVQATLGVGSVNFCTVDFGGVFFSSFYCVPCVLPDTLVLRSRKFTFCVKAALLAKRALVACFTHWFSE